MTTDIRAALERLVELNDIFGGLDWKPWPAAIAAARAALAAEPVPEGPSDEELDDRPTSENIWLLAQEYFESPESGVTYDGLIDFARAVLARWGHTPNA